tara:strand:+ start:460 stop:903 length:444 start_codon:yes stop_codon:yes gene_type:complete
MLSEELYRTFEIHSEQINNTRKRKQEALALRSCLETANVSEQNTDNHDPASNEQQCTLGVPLPEDVYEGDTVIRTLHSLLGIVDSKGYERSSQQVEFHRCFEIACSRVIYRKDFGLSKPQIMEKNGWTECFGEVMISTPRRFGKTFR